MAIKFEYGLKKNWTGDPCFPIQHGWDGVKCSNKSDNTMRITSLDLSKSYLHGVISNNFILLTALEILNLSYNNLSGSIPDALPSLPPLRVLDISGNQLSRDSLCKKYRESLVLRYESSGYLCSKTRSPSRKRAAIASISVVVSVLVVTVLVCFICQEKRKRNVSRHDHTRDSQLKSALGSRKGSGDRFTYKELEKFTNNFQQIIGKGGFGLVYYGRLPDSAEVAIKMRSESSSHGLDEFLAEVQSLTKVHHKNLVSLVGYCWEKDHLALVYEYMSEGSLCDHLRGLQRDKDTSLFLMSSTPTTSEAIHNPKGSMDLNTSANVSKNGVVKSLNWGTRLRVLLEAAQGLDYLHNGCNLPIIHRDVKTSNILLGRNLQAKIADFGLSKIYLSDTQTHISATNLAGTPGYIDPEYQNTGRLTESCDVYSFGIVVLEVATGEAAIVPGYGRIVQRVKQKTAAGDISLVADAQLGDAYDKSSMWKVVDMAMMCTADAAAERPKMAAVVVLLTESLALEEAREVSSSSARSGNDII
ncbi:hypothetical protein ACP70R_006539 [Stipagrostis hirtigluma subsp. patula]